VFIELPIPAHRSSYLSDVSTIRGETHGGVDHVFGYSFILTNLEITTPEHLAETEWWYRHRTDIEALNKDAKHGGALRHLPSKYHAVNTVWMWGALLACAISAWLQEITGLDRGNGRGRRTLATLCRELINVPARITRRAASSCCDCPPVTSSWLPSCPACSNSHAPADPRTIQPHQDEKDHRSGTPPTRRDSRAGVMRSPHRTRKRHEPSANRCTRDRYSQIWVRVAFSKNSLPAEPRGPRRHPAPCPPLDHKHAGAPPP
ncbi:transposase, partial [Agromyces bauzanensis]